GVAQTVETRVEPRPEHRDRRPAGGPDLAAVVRVETLRRHLHPRLPGGMPFERPGPVFEPMADVGDVVGERPLVARGRGRPGRIRDLVEQLPERRLDRRVLRPEAAPGLREGPSRRLRIGPERIVADLPDPELTGPRAHG